jgi:hypothetical protein
LAIGFQLAFAFADLCCPVRQRFGRDIQRPSTFAAVTIEACSDQVFGVIAAAFDDCYNVIYLEQHIGRMSATILAPEAIAFEDLEAGRH